MLHFLTHQHLQGFCGHHETSGHHQTNVLQNLAAIGRARRMMLKALPWVMRPSAVVNAAQMLWGGDSEGRHRLHDALPTVALKCRHQARVSFP